MSESSFAFLRRYLIQEWFETTLRSRYQAFIATTNSCANPIVSVCLDLSSCTFSLCRLPQAPADNRTFPALSLSIFLWMLDPILRCFLKCSFSFLPPEHRPSPRSQRIGRQQNTTQQLQCGKDFRSCRYSLLFRPPHLLATLVARTICICISVRWLLHPSRTRVVTFSCIGYANRPNEKLAM